MHYTEPVMRPPTEAYSVLIEATAGCSHNKCTFCGAYRETPFAAAPMEQIEHDIREAGAYYRSPKRVFLLSGDAFVLPYERLAQIADLVQQYLPTVETICMFSTIPDIGRKTDEQLRSLVQKKVNFLYLGTESGDQDVLDAVNKGYSVDEALKQIRRLEKVGIHYFTSFITGITGDDREAGLRHARRTAAFLNQLHPDFVGSSSLSIFDNTEIGEAVRSGRFHVASEAQMLGETREMLAHLHTPTFFFGAHASNMVPVNGRIPESKEAMLEKLDEAISRMNAAGFHERYNRDGRM